MYAYLRLEKNFLLLELFALKEDFLIAVLNANSCLSGQVCDDMPGPRRS